MNKYLRILSLFFVTLIVTKNSQAQSIPKIGSMWDGPINSSSKLYLPPPYDIQNKIEFQYNNIKFSGAVREGKIIGIFTNDTLFKINKKKYMNKPLSYFQNKDKIKLVKGWANYVPVEEGWYAAFNFEKITDSSKVTFLFKMENLL